jgi:hypothetical protein
MFQKLLLFGVRLKNNVFQTLQIKYVQQMDLRVLLENYLSTVVGLNQL